MVLSQEEIDACRSAFSNYEKQGKLNVWDLKPVMNQLGYRPTDGELFNLISGVDTDHTGIIYFSDFVAIIERQKVLNKGDDDDLLLDAFIACGAGNKSGIVKRETLVKVIKEDFGLTVDIEAMIQQYDPNGDGELAFDEFKKLLS